MSTTATDGAASPRVVRGTWTDFAAHPDWRLFMDRGEGTVEVGGRLVVHLAGQGGHGPTVLAATPARELRWLGELRSGPLFDAEYLFVLTRRPEGTTRLPHGDNVTGHLVALLEGTTKDGHASLEACNHAPGEHVECAGLPR